MAPLTERRRRIDQDAPVSLWLDRRRLGWSAAFVAIGLAALIVSASAGQVFLGLILIVALAILFVSEVYLPRYEDYKTTGVALMFRRFNYYRSVRKKTNVSLSADPALGESLKDRTGPKPAVIKPIGRVDFLKHQLSGGKILGLAWDHRYNTYSATMSCQFYSMFSDDEESRQEREEAFSRLLSSFAESGNLIDRFAWRWQTLLGEHQNAQQTVDQLRAGARLNRQDCPNRDVFLARTEEMGERSVIHRVTMTLAMANSGPRIRRLAKSVGGIEELLVQQLEHFYGLVMGMDDGRSPIGLRSANFLSYNDLVMENLLALNPVRAQPMWQRQTWGGPAGERDFIGEQLAWPQYVRFGPESSQMGETYHQSFALWEFTRSGFMPEQFWDILEAPIQKTVSIVFGMVPTSVALTRSQWNANAAAKTASDRTSRGRRVRATERIAEDLTNQREMEIASSQGEDGQVSCYISVWGATPEECDANAKGLYHAASKARFVIMPLSHRQERGIEAVMPIGRGLTVPQTSKMISWLS